MPITLSNNETEIYNKEKTTEIKNKLLHTNRSVEIINTNSEKCNFNFIDTFGI